MQVAGGRERRSWLVPAIVGGAALLVLAVWLALSLGAGRRWAGYLARLDREPGILVVSEQGGVRRSSIAGLADPYAADPVKLLAECGLDAAHVSSRWQPYVSLEPSISLARARAVLQPPGTVTLRLSGGTLSAHGSAPHRWAVATSARAAAIPGVLRYDADQLVDEGLAAIRPAWQRLEAIVLRFDVGAPELPGRGQAALGQAAAALQELAALARETGSVVRVDVVGHTDGTGSEGTNVRLSRARAEWVLSSLEAKGVRDVTFAILGVGASRPLRSEESADDRAYNRSVTFHVALQP